MQLFPRSDQLEMSTHFYMFLSLQDKQADGWQKGVGQCVTHPVLATLQTYPTRMSTKLTTEVIFLDLDCVAESCCVQWIEIRSGCGCFWVAGSVSLSFSFMSLRLSAFLTFHRPSFHVWSNYTQTSDKEDFKSDCGGAGKRKALNRYFNTSQCGTDCN